MLAKRTKYKEYPQAQAAEPAEASATTTYNKRNDNKVKILLDLTQINGVAK